MMLKLSDYECYYKEESRWYHKRSLYLISFTTRSCTDYNIFDYLGAIIIVDVGLWIYGKIKEELVVV
jgi:hypothetical protein